MDNTLFNVMTAVSEYKLVCDILLSITQNARITFTTLLIHYIFDGNNTFLCNLQCKGRTWCNIRNMPINEGGILSQIRHYPRQLVQLYLASPSHPIPSTYYWISSVAAKV